MGIKKVTKEAVMTLKNPPPREWARADIGLSATEEIESMLVTTPFQNAMVRRLSASLKYLTTDNVAGTTCKDNPARSDDTEVVDGKVESDMVKESGTENCL